MNGFAAIKDNNVLPQNHTPPRAEYAAAPASTPFAALCFLSPSSMV